MEPIVIKLKHPLKDHEGGEIREIRIGAELQLRHLIEIEKAGLTQADQLQVSVKLISMLSRPQIKESVLMDMDMEDFREVSRSLSPFLAKSE